MKITFKFENGTSQLILTPENPRDKMYLDLCMDGKREIVFKPTKEDCTILEFKSVENTLPVGLEVMPEIQNLPINGPLFCTVCKQYFPSLKDLKQHNLEFHEPI